MKRGEPGKGGQSVEGSKEKDVHTESSQKQGKERWSVSEMKVRVLVSKREMGREEWRPVHVGSWTPW